MNRSFSLSSSLSTVIVRAFVAATVATVAVGCAVDAEDPASDVVVTSATDNSEPQSREHILLAKAAGSTEESASSWSTVGGTITAGPEDVRCGDGSNCRETGTKSCDDFRAKCKATAGCGTTSTGLGDIAIVSCVAIPARPE